jgi:hypothetical protein
MWPGDDAPNDELPDDIRNVIYKMQAIKEENQDLEQFEEIYLDVVEDKLLP